MVEAAPSSVDLQEFQFKLHSKLKVFESGDDSKFINSTSLIAAASRYGIVFVGAPTGSLEVIQLKSIEGNSAGKVETTNYPKRTIQFQATPTHLALNCDQTLLAVVIIKNECATAIIYSVPSFLSQNVLVVREIRVSATPGVAVLETCWNPAIPTVYTACKADGSLGVYNLQENSVDINELPVAAGARCFCWSPKGKQLVVGSANGSLTQYKPDLKAVKAIQPPPLTGNGPFSALNVFWLTNYQFVAVYKDIGNADARPVILIVNAPKAGAITYINYDDICYSYGTLRPPQYYIIHQPTWGVLLVASANSMEVGVMGICQAGEPSLWQQWNQIDAARAELPLSASHQETFPVGFALDTGSTLELPWGENQTLPCMPMIHVLSHHGVLCSFSMINIRQGAAQICTPPELVADQSGLSQFRIQQQATPIAAPVATPITTPASIASPPQQKPGAVPTGLTFGAPVANAPTAVSSTGNTFIKPAAQPGTLFGAPASTPQLFGTTPNFSSPPMPATNTSSFSFKLPTSGTPSFSSMGGAPKPAASAPNLTTSFGAVAPSSTGALNFSSVSNAPSTTGPVHVAASTVASATSNTSIFSGLSATSDPAFGKPATSMFGLAMTTTPSFGSVNLTPKTSTPSFATSVVASAPNLAPAASSAPQNTTMFNIPTPRPAGQPLLATPKDILPVNIIQKPAPKPDVVTQVQTAQTPNQSVVHAPTPSHDLSTTKKDDSVLNDHTIHALIKEEVKNFNTELHGLFTRCKQITLDVGTEDEKSNLVLTTDKLLEFYRELQDITDSQVVEVHYLKQALMQSFAWYEDAKARHRRYTDPNFSSLLQSQELDPVSEKQLGDIKHLIYYIEAQLKQVDGFLDTQWADFQDSCKKHIKGKLHIPTLEPIYQSLIRQNAILDKHRYLLKDIGARIKSRNRKAASYPHVMNVINTTNDKDTIQIDDELRKLKIDHVDPFATRYDKIVKNEQKFSDIKQTKLCSFFTNRNVVHIAPRKPKFNSSLLQTTPAKIGLGSSFIASPNAQRSLEQTFDNLAQSKIESQLNNSAEANLSASNLFSFSLMEGSQASRLRTPDKNVTVQQQQTKPVSTVMFNTPKTPDVQQDKQALNVSNPAAKPQSTMFGSSGAPSSPGSVFNFTASSTVVTQSKPQFFTSNTNMQTSLPLNFSIGSNTTITPVSSLDKLNQTKPSPMFNFTMSNTSVANPVKTVDAKPAEPTAKTSQPEITLIKPNVVKSTPSESSFFGGLPTPDVKSNQPFSFTVPQPKLGSVAKEATASPPISAVSNMFKVASDGAGKPRDSLDSTAGFNFGSSLSLGQQSTPKPKVTTATVFGQVTTTSAVSITPIAPAVTSTATATTQIVTPKPTFSFTQPVAASSPQVATTSVVAPAANAAVTVTPVVNKPEPATPATTSTTSIFGGFALNTPQSSTASIFGQSSATSATTSTTSIFGSSQGGTNTIGSLFGAKVTPQTTTLLAPKSAAPASTVSETSTTSVVAPDPVAVTTVAPVATVVPAPAAAQTTTASGGFSFVQSAATVTSAQPAATSAPAPAQTTSIFGGAAATTSSTGFSFLQPAAPSTTATAAPKISSVFSLATENKPAETTNTGFGQTPTKATTESAFGFDSLAVSSSENKFSFGNLTVSALSPNASATPTTTTPTTTTAGFGTSFGANPFGKTATTTTASSFMGQPICSPSSFTQNSGSEFGQSTGNIFAQKAATTPSSTGSSIFGQSSGGSLFGGGSASAVTSTASIFGQTQSSPFGSPAAAPASTTGSIFGQTSAFGAAPAATTTSGSIFGQSAFGSPAATSASSSFSFTQNAAASTGFSSPSGSIFGAKPTFGQAPAFGQPPAFGAAPAFGSPTASSGSIFGGAASPTNNSNTFGGGATGGFGSPSAFGQKPAFGSPPNFGQQSTFGSPSTFGGPQRLFGSPTAQTGGTFGAVQENSTFANLANQSTLGFGSLAQNQQAAAPQQQAPSFSGGSQFSSWR